MKQIVITIIFTLNVCALFAQNDSITVNHNDSLLLTINSELKSGKVNFWKYMKNSPYGYVFGVSYDFMNFPNYKLLQDKWGIRATSKIVSMPFIFDVSTSLHSFGSPNVEQLIIDRNYLSYRNDDVWTYNPNFDRDRPYITEYTIRGCNISPSVSFCPLPFLPLKPQTQSKLSERFIPYIGIGYNLYLERVSYKGYYQTSWTENNIENSYTYNAEYQDIYLNHSFLCKAGMVYNFKAISIIAEYGYCFNKNKQNNYQYISVGLAISNISGFTDSKKPKKIFENNPKFIK